jgi:hypothetical protein
MESPVTNMHDVLSEVLNEASKPGGELEPSGLLLAIADQDDPIWALANIDQANILFREFAQEFGFVPTVNVTGKPLVSEDRTRWIKLIRWLTREVAGWRDHADPRRDKLVAIFVVTQSCDFENILWGKLPDHVGANTELNDALERMLSSSTVEFGFRQSSSVPVWEREAVETFRRADEKSDWVGIASECRRFENAFLSNVLLVQIVRYLYRYAFSQLVRALSRVRQTPLAMQIAAAVSAEQRLYLANEGGNPYVQFSCTYQTLSGHPKPRQLDLKARQLLTELLVKVANHEARWIAWMEIFNLHPLRYPALQVALGQALAVVKDEAVRGYINSIYLSAAITKPEESRDCVADCLREFQKVATTERRAVLWALAHERWLAWRFDQATRGSHVSQIKWSELDYAVVAYAVECMNEDEGAKAREAITDKLKLLDSGWHESLLHCVSEWSRLLSQFQAYAHASHAIQTGEDWLPKSRTYHPAGSISEYLTIMFAIG